MNIRKSIPDLFTALNLTAGCFGVVALFEGKPVVASSLIIVGGIFDFFDGFFARLLKTGSSIGKELDSLADLITFGLLPAFLMYYLFREHTDGFYPYVSFILVIAAAFRLARFNVDKSQKDDFKGLPTPANAFLVAGLMNIYLAQWKSFTVFFSDTNLMAAVVIMLSYLMVSSIRFFSFKFKSMQFKGNSYRYLTLVAGLTLIIFLRLEGIFFAILLYMVLSVYRHLALLLKTKAG